jgi:polygalacturonase
MIRFQKIPPTLAAAGLAALAAFSTVRAGEAADRAWAGVPEILARIVPPSFPKRDFDITARGAKSGGGVNCKAAFDAAIRACAEAGGGRVVVPAGKFLTGPIHLRSNVELHLADGAEIVFSDRFEDYLPVVPVRVGGVDLMNYSPLIYANGCENVAITGRGRLDGNAQKWWKWKETGAHFKAAALGLPIGQRVFGTPEAGIRPAFLCLYRCKNILLEDFTIGSGPNWTIHPVYCENLTVRGVTVDTSGPNNDGIDPDSCRDVLIERCAFSTGDDCIVLKSGYNEDGWRVAKPTENVIIRHCSGKRGHGGLVIGSEMSGGVRNVFLSDCEFAGTDRAIRIKSRRDRGGVVEKIYARDVRSRDLKREIVILNMDYSADKNAASGHAPPVFRDMCFERIEAAGAPVAIRIEGMADSPIDNIRFENLRLAATRGITVRYGKNLRFENLELDVRKAPEFELTQTSDVVIDHVKSSSGPGSFLKLAGETSRGIRISASPRAAGNVETAKDAPHGAVNIE